VATPLNLTLRLERRLEDRVQVVVELEPLTPSLRLDGVSLELLDRNQQRQGHQVVLPIAGCLQHRMSTTLELAASAPLPVGGRVVATAWWAGGSVESSCPTDMWTALGHHVRGRSVLPGSLDQVELESVDDDERPLWIRRHPWLDEPLVPEDPTAFLEPGDLRDDADPLSAQALAEELGLDAEAQSWLQELLEE
jgi:hypothetical protein